MALKSLEYRLLRALRVAQLDPNATVLFACTTKKSAQEAWTMLMNLPGKPNGFTYFLVTRMVLHENGGRVFVKDLETPNELSGIQVSHVWVDEQVSARTLKFLASRIRTYADRKPSPEPSGLYDPWKVTRIEEY